MPGRRRGGHGGEVELSGSNGDDNGAAGPAPQQISLVRLIFSCMVAGGVQYGWALQLSLLTPYVQVSFFFSRCMSFVSLIDTCDPSGNAVCITVRGGMQRSSMFLDSGYWISPIMQFKVQLGRSWLISRVSIFTFRASTTIRYRVFLLICLVVTLIVAKEVPLGDPAQSGAKLDSKGGQAHSQNEDRVSFIDIFKAFKNLPPGMPSVLLVTSLTWLSWFPFILYDTDWMGREVYHGNPSGTPAQIDAYDRGVRQGAVGLLLNSVRKLEMVVLMITSLLIEPMCRKLTPRIVWVISNMTMFAGMAGTSIISTWSMKDFHGSIQSVITADGEVRAAALATFAALGFPLAVSINQHSQASTNTYQWVLYSVPFAVTAQLVVNEGGGQG
ncbi:hypothetical protein GW17_00005677 [Ensete ventricosum]|nr:hypothetical protein GW17_00005677 [Ensete ventricosum]